jgi:hypothetical protein
VTSGGNFDFERLPEVKERAQNWQGLKKYFILRLPQRPARCAISSTFWGRGQHHPVRISQEEQPQLRLRPDRDRDR